LQIENSQLPILNSDLKSVITPFWLQLAALRLGVLAPCVKKAARSAQGEEKSNARAPRRQGAKIPLISLEYVCPG
jgi:hypothetical protein